MEDFRSESFASTVFLSALTHHRRMLSAASEDNINTAIRQGSYSIFRTTEMICRAMHRVAEGYEADWTIDDGETSEQNWFADVYLSKFPEILTLRDNMLYPNNTPLDIAILSVGYFGSLVHYMRCEILRSMIITRDDGLNPKKPDDVWRRTACLVHIHLRNAYRDIVLELRKTSVERKDLLKYRSLLNEGQKKISLRRMIDKIFEMITAENGEEIEYLLRAQCPHDLVHR